MNEDSNNPLFKPHIGGGRPPDGGQISRKTQQNFLVRHWYGLYGSIEFLQLCFEFLGFPQLSVPASLQLCCNEPVVRIDSFVSSRCQMSLISSLLDFQFKCFPLLLSLTAQLLCCFQRRLDSISTDRMQYFIRYCLIGPEAAKRNTPVLSMIHMRALAVVPKDGSPYARVGNVEHSTATSASKYSGE